MDNLAWIFPPQVLGQLDQKFIVCSLKYSSQEEPPGEASQLLVLFDQHAVHERVRLETIIQENFETLASGESVLCSAAISPPLELDLPEHEVRLMQAYIKKFNQRGLYFTKVRFFHLLLLLFIPLVHLWYSGQCT